MASNMTDDIFQDQEDHIKSSASAAATLQAPSADLSLSIAACPDPVRPGQCLSYALTVSNAGPSDAKEVVVTDPLPAGLMDARFSADGGNVWARWDGSYTVGVLPAGAALTILISTQVESSIQEALLNVAVVTAATDDPNPDNNAASTITYIMSNGLPNRPCPTKKPVAGSCGPKLHTERTRWSQEFIV